MKKALFILIVLGGAAVVGSWYVRSSGPAQVELRTAPVKRADVTVAIGATGTVEPEEVIDVGAQVAGKIEVFGTDAHGKPVDYGTQVEENMVLAHINDLLYAADVDQARAQLEQAKANVVRDQADLLQMKAKLTQAERNWKRAQELGPSKALSATDFDSYEAIYQTARATVAVGEAAIAQARTTIAHAEAGLKRAETNLSYCTIRSPVKGVIIDRRVNIGQTVVASLNAPSLFLIAKDLRRMQVWVAVNEADIGQIHPGQPVRFTVDAYRDELFTGTVGKVRLNASMTQNVVNYTVEVNTDNSSGRLLPYLTANVQFQVASRSGVLTVPNAALRWSPPSAEMVASSFRQAYAEQAARKLAKKAGAQKPESTRPADRTGTIWVRDAEWVRPLTVSVGLADASSTEVSGAELTEGVEVITGEIVKAAERTVNPFTPQMPGGPKKPG